MANPQQTLIHPDISSSSTVTTTVTDGNISQTTQPPVAILKLRKPRLEKKVEWTNDTVDNENMNKKKSKCCCIYEKKKDVGASDSEDGSGDECDNCSGHVERKKHAPGPSSNNPSSHVS